MRRCVFMSPSLVCLSENSFHLVDETVEWHWPGRLLAVKSGPVDYGHLWWIKACQNEIWKVVFKLPDAILWHVLRLTLQGTMQDVQILVMPQGYISQCPDLNRSECLLIRPLCMPFLTITTSYTYSTCSGETFLLFIVYCLCLCFICSSLSNMQWFSWTCSENHGTTRHFGQNFKQGNWGRSCRFNSNLFTVHCFQKCILKNDVCTLMLLPCILRDR